MQGAPAIPVGRQKACKVAIALFPSKTGKNSGFSSVTGMIESERRCDRTLGAKKKSFFEKCQKNTASTGDITSPVSLECVRTGEEWLGGMATVARMCEGAGGRA